MPYYIANVEYAGLASITIEANEKPKNFQPFRKEFQSHAVDMGVPQFKTQKAEIEEVDEQAYKRTKELMERNEKRWNSIFTTKKAIADVIRKTAKELSEAELKEEA